MMNSFCVKQWIVLLSLFTCIFILSSTVVIAKSSTSEAQDGIFNLQTPLFNKSDPIKLKGEWNFYPNQLSNEIASTLPIKLHVPLSWEKSTALSNSAKGFGTYSLLVSHLKPNQQYGFKMLDQVTSFNLWINEEKVASNGVVAKSKDNYKPDWKPVFGIFTSDSSGNAKFIVEISNFDYNRGGFWNPIQIGHPEVIFKLKLQHVYKDVFLFSSILIMGIFFLGMYLVHPKDKAMLYFSIFCLAISFRVCLTGERIVVDFLPYLSWNIKVRLEYFFGYLLLPLFGLFISHLFPVESAKHFKKFFIVLAVAAGILSLFFEHEVYTSFLLYYKGLAIFLTFYFFYLLAKVIIRKKTGGYLFLIALLSLLIALLKETFMPNEYNVIPYAAFIFIICFSLLNMQKYFWILQKNEILESKAGTDALTGLHNRDFFINYLENYFYSSEELPTYCLLFLDLDSFKMINDTYGHEAGDTILVEVSTRLKALCRSGDIICRYGGDEFLIFLNKEGREHAKVVSKRIIEAISNPVYFKSQPLVVGVSIGISCLSETEMNIEAIIKQSDNAMYQSKKSGGNHFTFFSENMVNI